MPAIDTQLLLDALLGLVVLLFVPFGIRRGVAKEAMVSGAILLGAAIAGMWGERWGDELASEMGLEQATARFAVATAWLLGSAFVLGYGGGAALGTLRPGLLARLAGGLLAALNGAVLLGYLLAFIDRYLDPAETFDDGIVTRALLHDFDWLLLGAAGLLAVCVVLGLIVTTVRRRREPREPLNPAALAGTVPPRARPVRVARDADAGKFEPPPSGEPRSGRFGQGPLAQTTPVLDRPEPRSAPPDPGVAWPGSRVNGAGNGRDSATPANDEWLRRAAAMTRPLDSERQPAAANAAETGGSASGEPAVGWNRSSPESGFDDVRWRVGPDSPENAATQVGNPDAERNRCPTCGAGVDRRDVFCPECGTTL